MFHDLGTRHIPYLGNTEGKNVKRGFLKQRAGTIEASCTRQSSQTSPSFSRLSRRRSRDMEKKGIADPEEYPRNRGRDRRCRASILEPTLNELSWQSSQ